MILIKIDQVILNFTLIVYAKSIELIFGMAIDEPLAKKGLAAVCGIWGIPGSFGTLNPSIMDKTIFNFLPEYDTNSIALLLASSNAIFLIIFIITFLLLIS